MLNQRSSKIFSPGIAVTLLVLLAVILTILFTFPSILHLNSALIGDGGDAYQYAGFQQLVANNLRLQQWPFAYTTLWRYPFGFDFSRGFDSVFMSLGGGLLLLLTQQPVLSYNLMIYLAFVFDFLAGWWFFRAWSNNRWLVLLASVLFAFSFYDLARAHGHANLLLTGGFPLVLAALRNFYLQTNKKNFFWLCTSVLVVTCCSAQYFVLLAIGLAVAGIVALLSFRSELKAFFWRIGKKFWQFVPILLLFALLWLSFFGPYIAAVLKNDYEGRDKTVNLSPHWLDFVLPAKFLEFPLAQLNPYPLDSNSVEYVVTFDAVLLILVLLLLPLLVKDRFSRFLSLIFFIFLLLSFGKGNPVQAFLPYNFLHFFPFSAVEEPGRFSLLAQVVLLWLLVKLGSRSKLFQAKTPLLLWVACLLVIALRLPLLGFTISTPYLGPGVQLVKALPGKAVLDIPADSAVNGFYPFWYQKSIVTGYPHFLANTKESLAFLRQAGIADAFTCGSNPAQFTQQDMDLLRNKLKSYDVQILTVRVRSTLIWPRCYGVLKRVNEYLPNALLAYATTAEPGVSHNLYRYVQQPLQTSLFFPQDGEFQLLGITLLPAPSSPTDFQLHFQDETISFHVENWHLRENAGQAEAAIDFYGADEWKRSVQAGQSISIESEQIPPDLGVVSFWYRYQPNSTSVARYPSNSWATKLYNDDDLAVYQWR